MTFYVEQLNTTRDEVLRVGEAKTLEDAIELAKCTIDEYLERHSYYNASADALYTRYQESGLIPCIFCDDGGTLNVRNFDHLHYASLQCVEVFKEDDSLMLPIASMELLPKEYTGIRC
jgi:hypothetical protein